ncbi:MFS transporter [Ferrimicrobium sp.]|uniref:MFS transporter n=1 Tax=Ferrimicrobium sp. TaxID=2926050 RepID=UPI002612C41B|nr:MFS transporter [Ferrimicrobium sp.]
MKFNALARWRRDTFHSLGVRNFRLFTIGQFISNTGSWMQSISIAYLVLTLSKSGSLLGLVTAAQFLPILLFGAQAGIIVDRRNRQHLIMVTQTLFMLVAFILFYLVAQHQINILLVFIFSLILGLINAIDTPARQSFVQELVGHDNLQNAVTLNAASFNLARAIGPAVVGIAIASLGLSWGFLLNAISFLAILLALVLMKPGEFFVQGTVLREPGQIRAGLRYVRNRPILLSTLVAIMIAGIFAYNFPVTIPLLAETTFHGHAQLLGDFMSLFGVGAIFGSIVAASLRRPAGPRLMTVISVGFALLMVLVALAPSIWLAGLALMGLGALSIGFNALTNATLQMNSRFEMRGRVMALYTLGFLGSTPIGAPTVGFLSQDFSPRWAFIAGALSLLVAAILFFRLKGTKEPLQTPAD